MLPPGVPHGPAVPGPPPTAPASRRPRAGWWARNWWGLLLLPVVLAAALFPSVRDGYDQFWKNRPRVPVTASPGGWVAFAGARMRVLQLTHPDELRTSSGRVVTLPDQVRSWRATIEFATAHPDAIGGCTIALEATGGALYAANPAELDDLYLTIAGCAPQDSTATPAPTFQVAVYFVLPKSALPAAVRITLRTELPNYARLTPPPT
ncbi:MAG: hypothetical protein V7603_5707 [Micromonosporaceae bacterium]